MLAFGHKIVEEKMLETLDVTVVTLKHTLH